MGFFDFVSHLLIELISENHSWQRWGSENPKEGADHMQGK